MLSIQKPNTTSLLKTSIGDRQKIHDSEDKMDDWAWTVAWAKKVGQSKFQFSVYSGNEISDVGFAFRLTSTFK